MNARRMVSRHRVSCRGATALAAALAVLGVVQPPAAFAAVTGSSYRAPTPVVRTLGNGLKVAVFSDARLGLVQAQLRVPAGVQYEPENQAGVAGLTTQLFSRGTTSRDASALVRDLDRTGGTIQVSAGREFAIVAGVFVTGAFEDGLELMSDITINPLFADAEVRRLAEISARSVVQTHQNPMATADEQIWPLALDHHPVSRPLLGTTESLARLTREPVRLFHRDHYRPEGSVLVIAGDISATVAFAAAEEWFGRWGGRATEAPAAPVAPGRSSGVRVRIVDRPGLRGCEVRIGIAVPGREAKDELVRALAGQMFELDVLAKAARTPGVGQRSSMTLLKTRGLWTLGASAPAESAAATVNRLRSQMRGFIANPPPATDVAAARRIAQGAYPLRFETLSGVIAQWSSADYCGLPEDYLQSVPGRLAALSTADVAAAIKASGSLDRMAVVVVGPANVLKPQLEALGPVEVVTLDAQGAADSDIAMRAPTPDEQARGRAILDAAMAAHGGADSLRSITDSIIDAAVEISMQGNAISGRMRQARKEPYRMVYLTSFEDIEQRQVLKDHQAWTMLGSDTTARQADSSGVAAMRSGFLADLPHVLLSAADPSSRMGARPAETVNGVRADVVDVRLSSGERRRLYFDAQSHRLLAMDTEEQMARVGSIPSRRIYRDYRPVRGVLWPFHEERTLDGNPFMTLKVSEIRVNIGILEREFDKPNVGSPPSGR